MKADLLLRSADGKPTVGEVKVSTARGDDADPLYALVQALALAAQLTPASQRKRLRRQHEDAGFAQSGRLDVLIFLFRPLGLAGPLTARGSPTSRRHLQQPSTIRRVVPVHRELAVVEARAANKIAFKPLSLA